MARCVWLLASLTLFACNAGGGRDSSTPHSDSVANPAQTPDAEFQPGSGEDAYRYLKIYFDQGLHRSGTAGDVLIGQYMLEEFQRLGLQTQVQPFEFNRFAPQQYGLQVNGSEYQGFPLYYSGLTPPQGISGEIVDVGLGTPADFALRSVQDKIVLAQIPLVSNFITPTLNAVREAAIQGGAIGLLVAIQGPQNEPVAQNVDPASGLCHLPTLVIGKQDGNALAAQAGQVATLTLSGEYEGGQSYRESTTQAIGQSRNILGILEGQGDGIIIMPQPTTGWFGTAAERGGPFGLQMTTARYYAQKYAEEKPPQTLIFIGTGGHELNRLGIKHFLRDNAELIPRITAAVHAGDGSAAWLEQELLGQIVRFPMADPNRFLFVSDNVVMQTLAEQALLMNGLGMPAMSMRAFDAGDQGETHRAGIPTVAVTGAHLWFHQPNDTPDKTDPSLLEPLAKAYIQMIDQLMEMDPDQLRQTELPTAGERPPKACPGEDLATEDPFAD